MSIDEKNASFAYSVNFLRILLGMHLITEEEYERIIRIVAAYYDTEKIAI